MRFKAFIIAIVVAICVSDVLSEKPRKLKKATQYNGKKLSNLQAKLEKLQEVEAELEAELEEELGEEIDSEAGNVEDIIDFSSLGTYENYFDDEEEEEEELVYPCEDIFCGPGRGCVVNDEGKGECRCVEGCEVNEDSRRKVCSNYNETWSSDCELYKMRCLCSEKDERCSNEKFEHMHIDYYGVCQEVPECETEEMDDFPRRMREWLFNIMRNMADRKELSDHFLEMEKTAEEEEDESKKWVNAAVWKWCELDGHPKDRSVSRHELFPLRAPLYTLEHCIAPFLNSCDADDDHYITLKEWTKCLELTEEHTEDLEDLCEEIRE